MSLIALDDLQIIVDRLGTNCLEALRPCAHRHDAHSMAIERYRVDIRGLLMKRYLKEMKSYSRQPSPTLFKLAESAK